MTDWWSSRLLTELADISIGPQYPTYLEVCQEVSSRVALLNGPGPDVEARDVLVDDISLRVLVPDRRPNGLVYYIHAGGWVSGSADHSETLGRKLADRTGCVFVLPNYRLAPDHPWPIPVHDCLHGLVWMVNELASEFDSDLPIFIAGEGAGAHLALEVQLNATREVRSALKGQILVSPVLDPDSNEEGAPGGQDQLISRPMIRWCWGQYLPSKSTQDRLSSYPLQRSQLVGLPATLIMTAEFDPVGRESEALGRELLASNVEVVTRRFDGQIHGFFRCLMLPVGELAFQELISFIRARLPIRGGVVAPRQMEWKGT